jgi:hypothetical protein
MGHVQQVYGDGVKPPTTLAHDVEAWRSSVAQFFRSIQADAAPYSFPSDYDEFQSIYGGLCLLDEDKAIVRVLGCGLYAMEFYEPIHSPMAHGEVDLSKVPLLPIAEVALRSPNATHEGNFVFVMSLGGPHELGAIFAVPFKTHGIGPALQAAGDLPVNAKLVAASFTEWLELLVDTGGRFNLNKTES